MLDTSTAEVTIGASILSLVTTGMYDQPLTLYREYIQNAVDHLSINKIEGEIKITIDKANGTIQVQDTGPGLTYEECLQELLPIGQSKKHLGRDRGFRGIGRLAGLTFADSVTFLSRSNGNEPVTRVVWTSPDPTDLHNGKAISAETIQDYVQVDRIEDETHPDHGFTVRIEGIKRNASDLLNQQLVHNYIAETCPVPFADDFPFSTEFENSFRNTQLPYSVKITFTDNDEPIYRQYGPQIPLTKDKYDSFTEFEEIHIPCVEDNRDAAIGWIGHCSYLGAIPKASRVRGIRTRVGNLQIGDERVFDQLFEEDRFNRWCIGEVYILDWRIMPNARRDYFERNPHLRNLENRLIPIFRKISQRCRSASASRNKLKKINEGLIETKQLYEIAASGLLTEEHAEAIRKTTIQKVVDIRGQVKGQQSYSLTVEELTDLEQKLNELNTRDIEFPISGFSQFEADQYQEVFSIMAQSIPTAAKAKTALEQACKVLKEQREETTGNDKPGGQLKAEE